MNRPVLEGLRLNVPAHVKHTRLIDWVAQIAALTARVFPLDPCAPSYDCPALQSCVTQNTNAIKRLEA